MIGIAQNERKWMQWRLNKKIRKYCRSRRRFPYTTAQSGKSESVFVFLARANTKSNESIFFGALARVSGFDLYPFKSALGWFGGGERADDFVWVRYDQVNVFFFSCASWFDVDIARASDSLASRGVFVKVAFSLLDARPVAVKKHQEVGLVFIYILLRSRTYKIIPMSQVFAACVCVWWCVSVQENRRVKSTELTLNMTNIIPWAFSVCCQVCGASWVRIGGGHFGRLLIQTVCIYLNWDFPTVFVRPSAVWIRTP